MTEQKFRRQFAVLRGLRSCTSDYRRSAGTQGTKQERHPPQADIEEVAKFVAGRNRDYAKG